MPVLLDGVVDRLLGEVVLQREGGDGQAVDEQRQVEGALAFVVAVAELAGDREAVLSVTCLGVGIAGRRCAVENVHMVLLVIDACT